MRGELRANLSGGTLEFLDNDDSFATQDTVQKLERAISSTARWDRVFKYRERELESGKDYVTKVRPPIPLPPRYLTETIRAAGLCSSFEPRCYFRSCWRRSSTRTARTRWLRLCDGRRRRSRRSTAWSC
jgi:hypothetical protein